MPGKDWLDEMKKIWIKQKKVEKKGGAGEFWLTRRIPASYTVEAAGIMAAVLFTMMILLDQAFHMRAETVGNFSLHERVERERHAIENVEEEEISGRERGQRWSLEITSPVFRPEESLRMWSLPE